MYGRHPPGGTVAIIVFLLKIFPANTLALSPYYSNVLLRNEGFVNQTSSIWTVISDSGNSTLSLAPFMIRHMPSNVDPTFGPAPDGSGSLRIHFNEGAYDFHGPSGGMSFYAEPMDFLYAKEVTFSYLVYFSKGFDFNKGGKLPGLYGGDDRNTAIGCSGGRHDIRCWSSHYMFRTSGQGELYAYLPSPSAGAQFSGNKQLCKVPPLSVCNNMYGASVGRGAWKWKTGSWTNVTQRIYLNDGGKQNGAIQVTVDGNTVINLGGLALGSSASRVRGIQMQSFFGGHSPDWASPKDQDIYTKDFRIEITQNF